MQNQTNQLFADKYSALQEENTRLRRKLARQCASGQACKSAEPPDTALLIETEPLPDLLDKLPPTLASALDHFEDQFARDLFLIAALPVLAGIMPNFRGYYGGGHYSPDLYSAVAMPAAAGKSECIWARYFGHEVDRFLRERSDKQLHDWDKTYRFRGSAWAAVNMGPRPHSYSLFIPGNSSALALLRALHACNNRGIIFHTEADSFYKTLNHDAHTCHNALQLAFQHEPICYLRRGLEIQIPHACLSIFLSATPAGLSRMIPSSDDPLFSRFLFYYSDGATGWKSRQPTFKSTRKENFVFQAGTRLFSLYDQLINRKDILFFELESDQWARHDRIYRAETTRLFRLGLGHLDSTIKRNAFIAWRICMILSALRHFEAGTDLKEARSITALETDFFCAIRLALAYLKHSIALSSLVNHNPDTPENAHESRIQNLLRELPPKFSTAKAVEVGTMLGFSVRSTKAYMKCLQGSHLIVRTGYGQYAISAG